MEQIQNLTRGDLNFFINQNVQIDIPNFVLSLICAVILSFFVQLFYIKFSSSLSNRKEFSKNFVILAVTTCIVIMIVKSSLALSLGLVGALSIVRFRAAIKEPEELIYLFLIIGVGLASGSGQYHISFILTSAAFIIIFFDDKFRKNRIFSSAEILNVEINCEDYEKLKKELEKITNNTKIELDLKSIIKQNSKFEIIYIIKKQIDSDTANLVIKKLNDLDFKDFTFSISKDIHVPL